MEIAILDARARTGTPVMCGAMWIVVTLLLGILLAPVAAESQQSAKNYRLAGC